MSHPLPLLHELRNIGLAERGQADVRWFPRHPWQRDLRGENLVLLRPYGHAWEVEGTYRRWVLPAGFIHDGASIPDLARPLVPKRVLARVAPHHDRGYRTCGLPPRGEHEKWSAGRQEWVDAQVDLFWSNRVPWSRRDLDKLMGAMMRQDPDGPVRWQRRATFRALRFFGWRAWNCL